MSIDSGDRRINGVLLSIRESGTEKSLALNCGELLVNLEAQEKLAIQIGTKLQLGTSFGPRVGTVSGINSDLSPYAARSVTRKPTLLEKNCSDEASQNRLLMLDVRSDKIETTATYLKQNGSTPRTRKEFADALRSEGQQARDSLRRAALVAAGFLVVLVSALIGVVRARNLSNLHETLRVWRLVGLLPGQIREYFVAESLAIGAIAVAGAHLTSDMLSRARAIRYRGLVMHHTWSGLETLVVFLLIWVALLISSIPSLRKVAKAETATQRNTVRTPRRRDIYLIVFVTVVLVLSIASGSVPLSVLVFAIWAVSIVMARNTFETITAGLWRTHRTKGAESIISTQESGGVLDAAVFLVAVLVGATSYTASSLKNTVPRFVDQRITSNTNLIVEDYGGRLPETFLRDARTIPGIRTVAGSGFFQVKVEAGQQTFQLDATHVAGPEFVRLFTLDPTQGTIGTDLSSPKALITEEAARRTRATLGTQLIVHREGGATQTFPVQAIVKATDGNLDLFLIGASDIAASETSAVVAIESDPNLLNVEPDLNSLLVQYASRTVSLSRQRYAEQLASSVSGVATLALGALASLATLLTLTLGSMERIRYLGLRRTIGLGRLIGVTRGTFARAIWKSSISRTSTAVIFGCAAGFLFASLAIERFASLEILSRGDVKLAAATTILLLVVASISAAIPLRQIRKATPLDATQRFL